jgi:hypothetical protein
MKTSDKGIFKIEQGENSIIFQPINSTVWLRKAELPELFGVNVQTINACMDSICKEKSIDIEKCCKYELYVSGKHIKYDIQEVNMEMVIAMAFRIDSYNAKVLKEWFIRRCIYGVDNIPLPEIQNFHWN